MQVFLLFYAQNMLSSLKKGVSIMNYDDYEKYLSKPRLGRYKRACGGNEQKAFDLYIMNIEISKKFYGVLSLFEVISN
jgi:hypothetical protein